MLTSLVNKSLVVYREKEGVERYRMLATIRQYGSDRLTECGENEVLHERHRAYYIALAKKARPQGKDALHWLTLLEIEHDNLRAALDRSFDNPENVEEMLESFTGLMGFWRIRGHFSEGHERMQAALTAESKGRTAARATALIGAANINTSLGRYALSLQQIEEAVAIRREIAEPLLLANALFNYGGELIRQGQFIAARAALEEALALELAHGGTGIGIYGNLATAHFYLGEVETAEPYYAKDLELYRKGNQREWESEALCYLGRIALARADHSTAQQHFVHSLTLCCELAYQPGQLFAVFGFAALADALGQHERAAWLFGAHDALHERIGIHFAPQTSPPMTG